MLYNTNCLEILEKIPDNSIDLIVPDPPYRTTKRGNSGNSGGMLKEKIFREGKVFNYNNINISEYAPEFYRCLKEGSHCYVMCNHRNLIDMLNTFTKCGFSFVKSLIWEKGNKIMGHYYMSCYEYILFFYKQRGVKINECGTPDILKIPNKKTKDDKGKNLHNTEKPVSLMEILIKNSSKKNDLIMDPFMGIGSTGVACKNLQRNFIGVEIDKNYYEIAEKRIGGIYHEI